MKILQVHNKYLQSGGEDFMLQAERIMLEKEGHEVIQYIRDNAEVSSFNTFKKIMLPFSTIFSLKAYFEIKRLITKELPDIVHFHNTFPLVSPSAYFACLHKKVPFVQRIPNYRFICPNALMLRNQKICNLCVKKKNPFYAVKYSCYRDSKLQSFIIALQLFLYGRFFRKHVQYIPNSPIVKELFLEAGFKDERLSIKSNLTDTIDKPIYKKDSFAIYVGRLSKEKGIATLAKAWKHVDFKLEVFGSGPVEDLLNKNKNIILHGHVSKEVYIKHIAWYGNHI